MISFVRSSTMANHEQMLRELLSDIANEQGYKEGTFNIEATSSGGANYTSVLYNTTISSPNKKDLKLFAKVGNLNEKTRETVPSFIFDTERLMYCELANIFKRIEEKAEVPEEQGYVFPKVYGYNSNMYEETIILENLAAQGYIVYDRMKSVDWPYAAKAVENIAQFHALTMAYREQKPEEFDELAQKLTNLIKPAFEKMSQKVDLFLSTAVSATREGNKEKLLKYFESVLLTDSDLFRFVDPKRRTVLIHGDFRPSNIMHRVNEDGSLDLILLDYQTVRRGNALSDLMYFIFTGSDGQFRARYYQRLVDHYYDSLTRALTRLRLDPRKVYPREDFDCDLQEALPYGLIIAVFLLPLVTVESEDAPDFNTDDIHESMAKPKTSPIYSERLNDIIDDYVRWGVL